MTLKLTIKIIFHIEAINGVVQRAQPNKSSAILDRLIKSSPFKNSPRSSAQRDGIEIPRDCQNKVIN
jgi:hypothetical protein